MTRALLEAAIRDGFTLASSARADRVTAIADVLESRGFALGNVGREVTTEAELDVLPVGSIAVDAEGDYWTKVHDDDGYGWSLLTQGKLEGRTHSSVVLYQSTSPRATVTYIPGGAS